MIDFLFIGPQATGKTCIMKVLQCKNLPNQHLVSGIEDGLRGPIWDRTKLREIGGRRANNTWSNEKMTGCKNICFVFNGIKMLEELENWKDGGETTSFLTHWYRVAQEKVQSDAKIKLWFIATYKDLYKGEDLVEDIKNAIRAANEEYKNIAGTSSKRYIFHDALNGALFAINAMESEEVIDVYHKIKKNK